MLGIRRLNSKFELVEVDGGYIPSWHNGGIYANCGDGNPIVAAALTIIGSSGLTFGDVDIGTLMGLKEFTLPVSIIAKNFRIFSLTASVGKFRHAIYRRSDLTKVWDSGYIDTVSSNWSAYPMGDLPLTANTPYWYTLISNDATYDNVVYPCPPSSAVSSAYFGTGTPPLGNLAVGLPVRLTWEFPTDQAGALPDVLTSGNLIPTTLAGGSYDLPLGYITTF